MSEDTQVKAPDPRFPVALEVAEQEFERFVEVFDLDVELEGMGDEDRATLDSAKRTFLRAVRRGSLTVDEKGQPVYTPVMGNVKPITFREYDGAALMEMDKAKKNHDVKKTNLVLAAVTKERVERFAHMKGRDLKVCHAIFGFLLGG